MSPKTVVIAGSTRGFGFATARACLDSGANVVICSDDIRDVRAAELALGPRDRLVGTKCDVTQPLELEQLIAFSVRRFGRIDVFINNAGDEGALGNTADVPVARGKRVLNTHVLGTYFGSVCALRQLTKQGGGRLVNIVGKGARAHSAHSTSLHVAAKAWVVAFTDAIRNEYATQGIEVGTYDPGLYFATNRPKLMVVTGEERRAAVMSVLTRILGAPADVPASELAQLALTSRSLPAHGRNARTLRVLARAFKRLVLRQPSPIAARNMTTRIIPAETSLLSN